MFEKLRIREHMEVADDRGHPIGIIDEIVDNRIKLTGSDGDTARHFIAVQQVDRIDRNRVYLKQGTPLPLGLAD